MQNQLLLRWFSLKHARKSKATFTTLNCFACSLGVRVQKLRNFHESNGYSIVTVSTIGCRRKTVRFRVQILFKITWNRSWLRPRRMLWANCSARNGTFRGSNFVFSREISFSMEVQNGVISFVFRNFVRFFVRYTCPHRSEMLLHKLWAWLVFEIWISA